MSWTLGRPGASEASGLGDCPPKCGDEAATRQKFVAGRYKGLKSFGILATSPSRRPPSVVWGLQEALPPPCRGVCETACPRRPQGPVGGVCWCVPCRWIHVVGPYSGGCLPSSRHWGHFLLPFAVETQGPSQLRPKEGRVTTSILAPSQLCF